jgi:hypothetical protein
MKNPGGLTPSPQNRITSHVAPRMKRVAVAALRNLGVSNQVGSFITTARGTADGQFASGRLAYCPVSEMLIGWCSSALLDLAMPSKV